MKPEEEIVVTLRLLADTLFEDGQTDWGRAMHNLLVYWKNAETISEKSDLGHHTLHHFGGQGSLTDVYISENTPNEREKSKAFYEATKRLHQLAFGFLK